MLSKDAAVEVTTRFQRRLATISSRAAEQAATAWEQLGGWDRVDIARFGDVTSDAFAAARAASVDVSSGYYALLADRPVAVPTITKTANIEAPFHAYWHALAEGSEWADAFAVGTTRSESIAADLVTGVSREVGSLTAGTDVVGWRRVLSGNSCAFCATAARQRYHSSDSATFGHDHCDCIVVPIYSDRDPGQVINARHLSSVADGVPGRT